MIVTPAQLNRRAELYHQLGSMLAAGIPLTQALEMGTRNPAVRSSRRTIQSLLANLQSGLTFSESMAQVQGWMPEFDTALLSVGEQSGRLDTSFELLSQYYATRASIIRDMLAGLVVTTATFHVFLLVFPIFLLQSFAQGIFYGSYRLCIPFIVEKIVVFGVFYGAVFLLIYACQGKRATWWRSIVEFFSQLVPVLRTAQRNLSLSRLAAALEALISAGVTLIGGWELAAKASGSPALQREISNWREQLNAGAKPAELINQCSYFPEMFANLYATGEQSGRIDDALRRLQVYYQEEGFRAMRMFTRILNGTIYALLVGLVALNVFRFYIGYFNSVFQGM